jgi:hypothetical protein
VEISLWAVGAVRFAVCGTQLIRVWRGFVNEFLGAARRVQKVIDETTPVLGLVYSGRPNYPPLVLNLKKFRPAPRECKRSFG